MKTDLVYTVVTGVRWTGVNLTQGLSQTEVIATVTKYHGPQQNVDKQWLVHRSRLLGVMNNCIVLYSMCMCLFV